jgi:hypothetical protein
MLVGVGVLLLVVISSLARHTTCVRVRQCATLWQLSQGGVGVVVLNFHVDNVTMPGDRARDAHRAASIAWWCAQTNITFSYQTTERCCIRMWTKTLVVVLGSESDNMVSIVLGARESSNQADRRKAHSQWRELLPHSFWCERM